MSNKNNSSKPDYLVIENDRVNRDKSLANYASMVDAYIASHEAERSLISACISHLFDENLGANISQSAIASMTVGLLARHNPNFNNPQLFGVLSKKVLEVLKSEIEEGIYASKKGPGLGTFRVRDHKPKV